MLFTAKTEDVMWLESVPPLLDIYFEDILESRSSLDDYSGYTKPTVWFEADHPPAERYTIGIAFSLADERLAYVPWCEKEKRFAYEQSRYIKNPPPMFMDAQKSGKMITLFDTTFDPENDMVLGDPIPDEIWQELRDGAEGKSEDNLPKFASA